MATSVGNLWVDVRFDTAALGTSLRSSLTGAAAAGGEAIEASMAQRLSAIGQRATIAGRSISYGLSIPLIAFGKVATSAFAEFDTQMTRVSSLVGENREQVKRWEGDVKGIANTYGQSATDTAEALYFITSSGIEAGEALKVLDVSAKGAAVGLGQQQAVADLVTSAMNAYGKENLSAAQAGDILTASVREGKAEADKMAGALSSVLPLAANLGVDMAELSGAMASMTLSGTAPDEAATQLRGLFNQITDLTPASQQALKAYTGLDYETLRANISTKGFITSLKQIFDIMKSQGKEANIGEIFGNIRAQTGLLNLFGTKSAQTLDIIAKTKASAGDLDRAWSVTAESASFKLKQATESIKTSLIDVGAAVAPAMTTVAGSVAGVLSVFGAMPGFIQAPVVGLGAMAAAAGPLTYSFGALARVSGGVASTISKLSPAVGAASSALQAGARDLNTAAQNAKILGVNVGGLSGIMATAGIAVAAAAVAYKLWNDKMEEGHRLASTLGDVYRKAAGKGGIGAAEETARKAREQIANLNAEIANSHSPFDADYRAQLTMGREELEKNVAATARQINMAGALERATGKNKDALFDWLMKEEEQGRTYKNVTEAADAYTKALREQQPAAVAVTTATEAQKNSLDGIIAAAKATADKYLGLQDAQRGVARAHKAIADAQKGVTDAQQRYADAHRATLAAERAIGEAQRKAAESTNALADARRRLTDAQNELNDALQGPSPEEQLNLESAQLAVQEAQKRARGKFETPTDRKRAQLDLRRSRLDLEREQKAHDERVAASQDKVTEAQNSLNDAQQAEVDANQSVMDAITARNKARTDEGTAYQNIAIAQDAVRQAQEDLLPATANLAAKQAELATAIYNGTANGEAFIRYLETLKAMEPGIAGLVDQYIADFKRLQEINQPPPPPSGAYKALGGSIAAVQGPIVRNPAPGTVDLGTNVFIPGVGVQPKRRAKGGPVKGSDLYEVNERNIPELLLSGGRQFLLPVDSGQIMPLEPKIEAKGGPSYKFGDINVYEAHDGRDSAVAVRRELRKHAFLAGGR
jgi:TP901 family phage tail tape measure protein